MLDCLYNQDVLWQMNAAERMAMFYTLDRMPNKHTVVEVGSFKGGCTKVLSQHFDKVISIDIDHSNIVDKDSYTNVEWVTGDSKQVLHEVLKQHVDLILIDGDHTYEGVSHDLSTCLAYHAPMILLHDSAYSETRNAIEVFAKSVESTYFVDIDFVPGVPFGELELIGGLAIFCKK